MGSQYLVLTGQAEMHIKWTEEEHHGCRRTLAATKESNQTMGLWAVLSAQWDKGKV